ncbi:hypothetical protein C8R41DRAFT_871983 [Lentinula lateritia]|uniref:Uncharacterized protein n=1 Tax=Lentinula lateritia TaxID=40482 RepID=A0ABQ8V068_9AGAR|nr:hypothetical protein C8R41DRAFT_871983 [Lentinula lateritia]
MVSKVYLLLSVATLFCIFLPRGTLTFRHMSILVAMNIKAATQCVVPQFRIECGLWQHTFRILNDKTHGQLVTPSTSVPAQECIGYPGIDELQSVGGAMTTFGTSEWQYFADMALGSWSAYTIFKLAVIICASILYLFDANSESARIQIVAVIDSVCSNPSNYLGKYRRR